jgi:hypothetical protein
MGYSDEQIRQFEQSRHDVTSGLQAMFMKVVTEGQKLPPDSRVREHLLHGAGRRISVIRRTIEKVFTVFPLSTTRPLSPDDLSDVQINLHAFVMNTYGLYDNWAWAFVLRHQLQDEIGDRRKVGLFLRSTQRFLPAPLRDYVTSESMTQWHEKYAKDFRDALAHRIPLYIPPSTVLNSDADRYRELEELKMSSLLAGDLQRSESAEREQAALCRPNFTFLHSFIGQTAKPILLHPQMLTDGMGVNEFGALFLQHWGERVN